MDNKYGWVHLNKNKCLYYLRVAYFDPHAISYTHYTL